MSADWTTFVRQCRAENPPPSGDYESADPWGPDLPALAAVPVAHRSRFAAVLALVINAAFFVLIVGSVFAIIAAPFIARWMWLDGWRW